MKLARILVLASVAVAFPSFAALTSATLAVSGMTCSACPITVKKALSRVDGVSDVKVSFKSKQAVVKFDDAKTTAEALTKATAAAGYPSQVTN